MVIYAGSLNGPYLFDDLQAYGGDLNNVAFPPLGNWLAPETRPLLQAWFWILSGFSTTQHVAYRIAGVLIHVVNATLVYFLSKVISDHFWSQNKQLATWRHSFVVAAIWLVHPVCVQAVCSIVQQAELLMSMFLLCYLMVVATNRSRPRWHSAMMAYFCLACGIHSKIVMITAVPVGLLLDALISNATVKQVLKANWQLHLVPLLGAILLAIALIPMLLAGQAGIGFGGDAPPAGIYLMSSFRSLAIYVGLTFWPASLAIDRGPHFITDWSQAAPYAIGLAIYAGLACFAWKTGFGKKPARRLLAWLMLSPLFILAPTNSFVPTADPVFEHRFYLPLAFVISAVVLVGYGLSTRQFGHLKHFQTVAFIVVGFIIGSFAIRSSIRARDYASSMQVWRSALMVDGDNARAAQNFVASMQESDLESGISYELKSLIVYADMRGQRIDALAHQLAKVHLRRAEPEVAFPILAEVAKRSTPVENLITDRQRREVGERWFDLAVASFQFGRGADGVRAIQQTLLATPNDPFAHAMAGDLYEAVGNQEAANRHWQLAQELAPDSWEEADAAN